MKDAFCFFFRVPVGVCLQGGRLPERTREMAKYIVETPEQATSHGEQWSAVNKLVKLTLEQSQREVLDINATAGVGLVLDRAMEGTLHIIEVVPGGAGAVPPLCVAPSAGPTRVPHAAVRSRVSAARALTGLCAGLWVAAAAQEGHIQRVPPPARPPAARTHPTLASQKRVYARMSLSRASAGSLISCRSLLRIPALAGKRRETSCSV